MTGTAPETELVRALAYLKRTESIRFNEAQIKYLESVNLNWGRHIHEFETAGEDIRFSDPSDIRTMCRYAANRIATDYDGLPRLSVAR